VFSEDRGFLLLRRKDYIFGWSFIWLSNEHTSEYTFSTENMKSVRRADGAEQTTCISLVEKRKL